MAKNKKVGLEVVVSATDKATAQFKEINKRFANSGLGKLNNSFRLLKGASGFNQLGKAVGNFGGAISNASSEFQGLLLRVGALAGLGGGGLFALSKGFSDFADNVQDSSDRLGIGVASYQRLSIAAGLAGVDQQILNSTFDKFTKNLGEAKLGNSALAKTFGALRVSIKGKKVDVALEEVLGKLAKIGDASKRNAVGMKLFGKQFGELVPFIKDFQDVTAQAGGFVLSEDEIKRGDAFKNQLQAFYALMGNLRNIAGSAMLDGFSEGLKIISQFLIENKAQIKEFFTAIGKELPNAFRVLTQSLKSVMNFFSVYDEKTGKTTLNMQKVKTAFMVFSAFMAGPFLIAMGLLIKSLGVLLFTLGQVAIGFAVAFPWLAAFVAIAGLIYAKWEPIKQLFSDIWEYIKSIGKAWSGVFSMENLRGISAKVMGPAPVAQRNFLQAPMSQTNNATASLNVNFSNMPKGAKVNQSSEGFESLLIERGYAL